MSATAHVPDRIDPLLRRHALQFRVALAVVDAVAALMLALALSEIRFEGDSLELARRFMPGAPLAFIAAYVGSWVALLWLAGLYRLRARWSISSEAWAVVRSAGALGALAAAAYVLIPHVDSVRALWFLFPLLVLVTLLLRGAIRVVFEIVRSSGRNSRFVLVLGTGDWAQAFARRLEEHEELGLRVVGFLGDGGPDVSGPWPYLGPLASLESVLHDHVIDEVAICLPLQQWHLVEPIARLCEDEGKIVRLPLGLPRRAVTAARVEELDGIPVFSLVSGPDRAVALALKRFVDLAGAAVGLVVLAPLFVAVALIILAREGRPVLFLQERVGLHGRTFRIVKFRTMVADAEAQLAGLRSRNEVIGAAFKVTDDPRVSTLGRWLRRTSIDELPQLWNVLRGEMSLVGPRPPLPSEVAEYDVWHRRRLSMKPGITGLWQVEARRLQQFDGWVERDLRYIDSWSMWLDLRLMAQTIPAMLQGR